MMAEMAEFIFDKVENTVGTWEKEKKKEMLVTKILSFSCNVFQGRCALPGLLKTIIIWLSVRE